MRPEQTLRYACTEAARRFVTASRICIMDALQYLDVKYEEVKELELISDKLLEINQMLSKRVDDLRKG